MSVMHPGAAIFWVLALIVMWLCSDRKGKQ
jgi:hypothetical protein